MTRAWTMTLALMICVFAAYGCGDEETPEDKLVSGLDEFQAEVNEQAEVSCDCWQESNFASREACQEMFEILPSRRRCIDDALAQDVTASQQWLDCTLPLEAEYTTCINDKLMCDVADSLKACVDDYNTGTDNCIKLPNAVDRDYNDCF